jgi:hypothetical protein
LAGHIEAATLATPTIQLDTYERQFFFFVLHFSTEYCPTIRSDFHLVRYRRPRLRSQRIYCGGTTSNRKLASCGALAGQSHEIIDFNMDRAVSRILCYACPLRKAMMQPLSASCACAFTMAMCFRVSETAAHTSRLKTTLRADECHAWTQICECWVTGAAAAVEYLRESAV